MRASAIGHLCAQALLMRQRVSAGRVLLRRDTRQR